MAVFYTGPRPVTKGRNSSDSVHTWKGVSGTYSNWSLFNTSHVLDGAPNNDVRPGAGSFPHGLMLSRYFEGLDSLSAIREMATPGHTDNLRFRPLENKAAGNALAFKSGYGHVDRVTSYSLIDQYDDTYRITHLDAPGHTERSWGSADSAPTGTAATFGKFDIYVYKGVTDHGMLASTRGTTIPTDAQSDYGRNKINEWRGVTSSKALDV